MKFWQDQVHSPALTWLANGARGKAMTPQEVVAQGSMTGGAESLIPAFVSGATGHTQLHRLLAVLLFTFASCLLRLHSFCLHW